MLQKISRGLEPPTCKDTSHQTQDRRQEMVYEECEELANVPVRGP